MQLIHPVDIGPYREVLPKGRDYEDLKFTSVQKILAGLIERNPAGLVMDRNPQERLIITCRYHAILLASMSRHRGTPVRVRAGFAPYLARDRGLHICHLICEVWNDKENRWMFVDPDKKMVDFPRKEFELACDVWLEMQTDKIDAQKYGVARTWGKYAILDMLCHDFAAVQGHELTYWERPPISADEKMDVNRIDTQQLGVLNEIANLLKNPDRNMQKLQSLHAQYEY